MPYRMILPALLALSFIGYPASASDNQGFIYGTVTLFNGDELTGFLRWDSEKGFWDDIRFFTSAN